MELTFVQNFLKLTLVAFGVSAILAPVIIYFLYNKGVVSRHLLLKDRSNQEFVKHHKKKSGTPTMGGFIITAPFIVLSFLLIPESPTRNTFLTGYVLFAGFGFLDEFIVKAIRDNAENERFRQMQENFIWRLGKFLLAVVVGFVMVYMLNKSIGVTSVNITKLFAVPFSGIFLLFWAGVVVAGTYGAEITDGLDGLVTGLFLIAYLVYAVIVVLTGHPELAQYIALIFGASLVYLYFNITPARIFMGGVGAMPLGFGLIFVAIITNTVVPYFIITSLFWIELFSSAIQMISLRFFNKRILRIAPIHHHFESIGWSEAKVVQRFWLAGVVCAILGLAVFVSC